MRTLEEQSSHLRPDDRSTLKPVLDLLASAAGLLVIAGLAGRAVMWARFNATDLPATTAVSLMSSDALLSVGAGAIASAVLLGVVAAIALYAIRRTLPPPAWAAGDRLLVGCLVTLLCVTLLAIPASWEQRISVMCAGAVAGAAYLTFAPTWSSRRAALALVVVIAAGGALVEFVRNSSAPAGFDTAVVYLHGGAVSTGAFIGASSDEVSIAPDLFGRLYGVVTTIPRNAIDRVAVYTGSEFGVVGTADARSLLGSSVHPPDGAALDRNLAAFLAGFAGGAAWKYPPRSLDDSLDYLVAHTSEFLGATPGDAIVSVPGGVPVTMATLARDSEDYAGEPVTVRGKVVRSAPALNGARVLVGRVLTLDPPTRTDAVAFCFVPGRREFATGSSVRVRGVVVLSGVTEAQGAALRNGVFIEGSWVRPVA